ncbi:Ephrin type-A receptor 2, partial [Acropora cervicornis]
MPPRRKSRRTAGPADDTVDVQFVPDPVETSPQAAVEASTSFGVGSEGLSDAMVSSIVAAVKTAIQSTNAAQNSSSPTNLVADAVQHNVIGVPLGSRLSARLKNKIWAEEFVTFGSLLDTSPNLDKFALSFTPPTAGNGSQTPNLRQGNPPKYPWGVVHWELWDRAMTFRAKSRYFATDKPGSGFRGRQPMDYKATLNRESEYQSFYKKEELNEDKHFVGRPLKHYKVGNSAQLVMCGVMVFFFGRSCHSVIDLTGNGTTTTYNCPKLVHNWMLNCWESDKTKRPTFADIVDNIDKFLRSPEDLNDGLSSVKRQQEFQSVDECLQYINMDKYCEVFRAANINSLDKVTALGDKEPREIGIKLIGHRNKMSK